MPYRTVDTHVHIWNFDRAEYSWLRGSTSVLARSYHLEELEEERKSAGITDGVLVQAANNFEDTDWMLHVAGGTEWIKGVVGWLPLTDPGETEKSLADKYLHQPYFKGVRHLIHDEPDPTWLLQPEVLESLAILSRYGLPYDVVGILPQHIEAALKVAEKIPDLRLVFDHLNQPPASSKERFGRWGQLMKEAAAHPSFFAKISGLGTASKKADWSPDDIRPSVEFCLEHFGTDRCFCGGDWPVCLLAGSYSGAWKNYRDVLDGLLDENQKEQLYSANAVAFYNL